jgi:hypothetical protein
MPQLGDLRGDIPVAVPVPSSPVAVPVGGSFIVPFNATITAAKWIPGAAITANGTNFFTLSFRNRVAGAGTVQFATARSYASGNSVLSTPEALTLSSTASDLLVAAGDALAAEVTHSGSGLICPGGVVMVTLRAR